MTSNSNDEYNFPQKLLLPNTQIWRLPETFANNSLANVKLSKSQFFSRFLGPLLRTGLPLMKNVLKPLAKSVLLSLGLTSSISKRFSYSKEIF